MKKVLLLFLLISSQLFSTVNIKFNSTIPSNSASVKFASLVDFSIDNMGNVYLLDEELAKVFCFDKDGNLLETKGKLQGNNLKSPVAIEISKENNILILDGDSKRVLLYGTDGKLKKMFGNSNGDFGSFDNPVDMALDNNSNIFIVDDGNNYLLKFNSDGLFRGGIKVSEPIAVDVDEGGNIHVLVKTNAGYLINIFNKNFAKKKNIRLPQIVEPKHFSINSYNEYYIIDSESGNASYLDSAGAALSSKIGVKSSTKGRQQFSEPTRIFSKSINANEDILFIMDPDFKEIQSFTISTDSLRNEIKPLIPKYDLRIIEDIKRTPAIDITFDNEFEYSITNGRAIICTENGETKYKITSQTVAKNGVKLIEPVALEKFNDKLFVVDRDENKVVVFNSTDGSYAFAFGESGATQGKFDSPSDIVSDEKGNLYIADLENSRVNVYSNDGIFKNEIKVPNQNPYKLTYSDNKLYILVESNEQIYIYNVDENALKAFPLARSIPGAQVSAIASTNGGFLFLFNESNGVAYIFRDNQPFAQFLSIGNDKVTLEEVSTMGFNPAKNNLIFFNNSSQKQLTINFSIAPDVPKNLKFAVSDGGEGLFTWENKDINSVSYNVLRKKVGSEKYFPLSDSDTTHYYVNYRNSDTIYNYVVQSVSASDFKSDFSNGVVDDYSYYLKLKETDAKLSVEKLLSVKELNEDAINNQIMNIYSTLIITANNENNYNLVFGYYEDMKKIFLLEPSIYLDESNLFKKLLRFDEGALKLEEAVKVIPDNQKIWSKLIRLKTLAKNYEGAVKSCKNALKVFPEDEKLQVDLAESYSKLDKNREASNIYKSLAMKHSKEDYYVRAGNLLIKSELIQEAIDLYQLAENSGIEGAKLYSAWGKALIEKGDFANGEFQIEKSLKLDNSNAESYYYLALANSKKRNMKAAIDAYKRSIELDMNNPDVLLDYGLDLVRINKYDDAIRAFEMALDLDPTSVEVAFNLGRMYARKKNLDLAVKHLSTANRLFPESAEIEKELSNALLAREKYNKNRPPIEITLIDFDDIFPSFLSYYESQPIGEVSIFNTKNEIYDDIKIEVKAPGLITSPAEFIVPIIYPNETSVNLVYLQLDNALIANSFAEDKDYDVTVTATYMKGNKNEKFEMKSQVKVYQLNSISWNDKKHLASFINPRDENLRTFITSEIIAKTTSNDSKFNEVPKPIRQAAQVWEYLRQMNLSYVQDPNSSYALVSMLDLIDYVQYPNQTLVKKVGDCDDLVSLLSNSLEVLGIETAYIDVTGHVFLAFNTGLAPSEIEERGLSDEQVIIKFNKVWFPLETTVIGKNSFVESWKSAMDRYKNEKKENNPIEIVEIQNASITFPPITFPNPEPIVTNVNVENVKLELAKDFKSFTMSQEQTYEEELLKVLNKYPKNFHIFNKLGIYYAKKGKYFAVSGSMDNAEIFFIRTLQYDKENTVALINLGNIGFLRKDYGYAERKYLKALKHDQQNLGVLANLARCSIKQNKTNEAIEYYKRIEQIDPDYAKSIKEFQKN